MKPDGDAIDRAGTMMLEYWLRNLIRDALNAGRMHADGSAEIIEVDREGHVSKKPFCPESTNGKSKLIIDEDGNTVRVPAYFPLPLYFRMRSERYH